MRFCLVHGYGLPARLHTRARVTLPLPTTPRFCRTHTALPRTPACLRLVGCGCVHIHHTTYTRFQHGYTFGSVGFATVKFCSSGFGYTGYATYTFAAYHGLDGFPYHWVCGYLPTTTVLHLQPTYLPVLDSAWLCTVHRAGYRFSPHWFACLAVLWIPATFYHHLRGSYSSLRILVARAAGCACLRAAPVWFTALYLPVFLRRQPAARALQRHLPAMPPGLPLVTTTRADACLPLARTA